MSRSHHRISLAVMLALCAATSAWSMGKVALSKEESSSCSAPVGRLTQLDVSNIDGDIRITGVARTDCVRVFRTRKAWATTPGKAEAAMLQVTLTDSVVGNTYRLGQTTPPDYDKTHEVVYEITVPSRFRVNVTTRDGDVAIRNVRDVVISNGNGASHLAHVGRVEANNGDGDMRIDTTWSAVQVMSVGGDVRMKSVGQVNVTTAGGKVEVDTTSSSVTITTGGGDVRLGRVNEVTVRTDGGDVDVECTDDPVQINTRGGRVRLNRMYNTVNITTTGGDVEIRTATQPVTVQTGGGGDVTIDDVAEPVQVTTDGGDVTIRRAPKPVQVTTRGGDVVLGVTKQITVQTTGGDVRADTTAGPVTIRTEGGSVTSRIRTPVLPVEITTESGDITLNTPEKIRGELEINTTGGGQATLQGLILINTSQSYAGVRGRICRGGNPIRLTTSRGHVRVTRDQGATYTDKVPEAPSTGSGIPDENTNDITN